jgi:hypothetical protein
MEINLVAPTGFDDFCILQYVESLEPPEYSFGGCGGPATQNATRP